MIHQRYKAFLESFLDKDEIESLLSACRKALKKTITIADHFCQSKDINLLDTPGWHLRKSRSLESNHNYYIDRDDTTTALGLTRQHQAGCMYIQESAASIPASLVSYHDGMQILDMCASPGGKTTQLWDGSYGYRDIMIVANEIDPVRLNTLKENMYRMHAHNIAYTKQDATVFGTLMPSYFDCVLLDAPCSGEGTAFKSDDALSHRRIEEIKKIANLQYQLLKSAYYTCKAGAQLIYSTCTINPLENECNISKFLQEFPDMEIQEIHIPGSSPGIQANEQYQIDPEVSRCSIRAWPHIQYTGGFFIAMMYKKVGVGQQNSLIHKYKKKTSDTILSSVNKKTLTTFANFLLQQFGIANIYDYHYTQDAHYIYACGSKVDNLVAQYSKTWGIPIAKKLKQDQWIPLEHIASLYHGYADRSCIDLPEIQVQEYLNGKHITCPGYRNGWYIIRYQGKAITVAKCVDGMLKYRSSL